MGLPKIISVDDHVVEPPHVWQSWLPAKHRAKGPRVERKRWAAFVHMAGARYQMAEDPEGEWGDAWIYEDRLIYVHKRFVAIPRDAMTRSAGGRAETRCPPGSGFRASTPAIGTHCWRPATRPV